MSVNALIRISYRFGLGGNHPPVQTVHLTYDNVAEAVADIATRFPLTFTLHRRRHGLAPFRPTVRLDQHNGGGLDLRCHLSETDEPEAEVPPDRCAGSMGLDVYLTSDAGIDDGFWADTAEAVRAVGVYPENLDIKAAPSSHNWYGSKVRPSSKKVDGALERAEEAARVPAYTAVERPPTKYASPRFDLTPDNSNDRPLVAELNSHKDGWLVVYGDVEGVEFATDYEAERAQWALSETLAALRAA